MAVKNSEPLVLEVHLNDHYVGTLTRLPDDRVLFAFDESFIDNPDRPIVSLWFKTTTGALKTKETIRSQATLPPVFSNLLPGGHLREYVAKRVGVKPGREFFLLGAIGNSLPGALTVTTAESLVDDSPENSPQKVKQAGLLHFSLLDIQIKFSAIAEASGGLTVAAEGEDGSWILKLPSRNYKNIPESEYSMLYLAREVGIEVPQFKLMAAEEITGLPEEFRQIKGKSLAVKRFDRGAGGQKIHMEDFAQIFGVHTHIDENAKYTNGSFARIGTVIFNECSEENFEEYIRRLVFCVLFGNGDMHIKNWSLLYKDWHTPSLSPAYDLVPAIAYLPTDNLGLRLGNTKAFKDVRDDSFAKLATTIGASEERVLEVVHNMKDRCISAWKGLKKTLPMPDEIREKLDVHIAGLNL